MTRIRAITRLVPLTQVQGRTYLWLGVLVPVVYFGSQLVAARFYPRYSFVTQSASELGSDRSNRPAVLNSGAILTGIATVIAAFAFLPALRRQGTGRVMAILTTIAMVSMGAGAIWAGSFPLPDPRHNPKLIGAGAFLVPLFFALSAIKWHDAPALRRYLFANLALFVLLIPVMSGATPIDVVRYRGVMQRIAAGVLYIPVGVVAASLLRRRVATSDGMPVA